MYTVIHSQTAKTEIETRIPNNQDKSDGGVVYTKQIIKTPLPTHPLIHSTAKLRIRSDAAETVHSPPLFPTPMKPTGILSEVMGRGMVER
jgi:hypothetical protein